MPAFIANNLDWFISGAIVVLGLFVYGLRDVLRIHLGRIWAISTVCFRDAIRRRVLWITPLAMLGIIAMSQFQKGDELDFIRLSTKICLFTTGLVVVIIALVTAATNLPREIENRVVFTIVTKPVTRLEIVFGKIVGFARVSALMLIVMGLFSLVYLHTQSWWIGRQITAALASPTTEETRRAWLRHYNEQGLLQAQVVSRPRTLQQYGRLPEKGDEGGWIVGGIQDALIRLEFDDKKLLESKAAPGRPGGAGFGLLVKVGYEPLRGTSSDTSSATSQSEKPRVVVQIQGADGSLVMPADQLGKSANIELSDPKGEQTALIPIPPDKAEQLSTLPAISVQLIFPSGDYIYHVRPDSAAILVPDSDTERHFIVPRHTPLLRGTSGRGGQQLTGPSRGVQPVAVYAYRDAPAPHARDGRVPFEMNVNVEKAGSDSDGDVAGTLEVRALDHSTGETSPPTVVYPESRRTVFFDLPEQFVKNGNFDLLVRNKTNGHTISLTPLSVSMISGQEYFGLNLFKAVFVLWLLAILTATVAFWCSTFLSWPIAVVLSTLIVLGHWGISNVDLSSGVGAAVANDFFSSNAPVAKVVNSSVETLSRTLTLLGSVLPDITQFGVTERVERGASLSVADIVAPIEVLLVFGLPLVTLSYVFLRNKEVAP
ncbi:MAG: hypothetical protein QM754_15890 [Tepidisphaeraceae bacterium]